MIVMIKSLAEQYKEVYEKEKFEKEVWKSFSKEVEKQNKNLKEENRALKEDCQTENEYYKEKIEERKNK